jgi:hypothetical protein
MGNITNGRIALIHVAKARLGLDGDAYRAVLSCAGVESAADIQTDEQFNVIMNTFSELGFVSNGVRRGVKYRKSVAGDNPDFISRRQEYYIRGLWDIASRTKDERSLRRMIRRIGKVDDISFLPRRSAQAVILALRDICWKAGFNPDHKG